MTIHWVSNWMTECTNKRIRPASIERALVKNMSLSICVEQRGLAWEDVKNSKSVHPETPWNSRACFGRKSSLLPSLWSYRAALWMMYVHPSAVCKQLLPHWKGLSTLSRWEGFLQDALYWSCYSTTFFTQPRVKVQADHFYCHWWNCHSGSQQTHHWIFVWCLPSSFGSWTTSLFLAKYQILIKVCLTWINAFEIIRAELGFIVGFGIHSHKGKHQILMNLW